MVAAIIVASDDFSANGVSRPLEKTSVPFIKVARVLMQKSREYGFDHHIASGLIRKCPRGSTWSSLSRPSRKVGSVPSRRGLYLLGRDVKHSPEFGEPFDAKRTRKRH